MKLLLILLLSVGALEASKEQYDLIVVDPATFADYNFWETPAGQKFWDTPEGKAALKAMEDYQLKVKNSYDH